MKEKIEIKRMDDGITTFWSVFVNDNRVSDFITFRKAWNCARKLVAMPTDIILDPLDA